LNRHIGLAEYDELIGRYDSWRDAYTRAGKPAPNEPDRENGRLYFRIGYPYPDWRAFIIEKTDLVYQVLSASTERSTKVTEGWKADFSRLEDAGKYIIATIADYLRIECRADPTAWKWRAAGLDPQVQKEDLPDGLARYSLLRDPSIYMITNARGIKPEHHVLALSYEDLRRALADGLPDGVAPAP
jgi:hypothetical protein